MGISRRAVVATTATAAALALGGCAAPWYGGPWGYGDYEESETLYFDGQESGSEGWTSFGDDQSWPSSSWEEDNEDAVPVLEVSITGADEDSDGELLLDVYADVTSPSGWTTSETWRSGAVEATEGPVTVHGSPSSQDTGETRLTVNAWDSDGNGNDVYWYGTLTPTEDGGWDLADGSSADSPIPVEIDLAAGETVPPSDPDLADQQWQDDGLGPIEPAAEEAWTDTFAGGTEVATITVEGEVPEGAVLMAYAYAWGMESEATASLLTTRLDSPTEITVIGPDRLWEGATLDSYLDLSLWVETDSGYLDWSEQVTLEDGAWLLDGEPIELVLDLDAGTVTANGEVRSSAGAESSEDLDLSDYSSCEEIEEATASGEIEPGLMTCVDETPWMP